MQQERHTTTTPVVNQWSFWSLLAIAFFLAIDIATNLVDFPIRLLLLQFEVWLAERVWRHRFRMDTDEQSMAEYVAA
jgi:hypothetical protein